MQVHLTLKSANAKTGPIPVSTTASDSCPTDCAMRDECYAATGPLALHWKAVSAGQRGTDWPTFTAAGPVVVVLPSTQTTNTTTPKGRPVVICPATQRDNVSCATCQLCQRQRGAIVGFPAHGSRQRVINMRLAA